MYPKCLEQCPVHSTESANIFSINSHLLYTSTCAKGLTNIFSFNLHKDLMKCLYSHFTDMENKV